MNQSVILITESDEVLLGTVDEIINGAGELQIGVGMSFAAAITDIVAGIIGSQEGHSRLIAIEICELRS